MSDYWTLFSARLPTRDDADERGFIDTKDENGTIRTGMWDWIQPSHSQARELWRVNGFVAWCSRPRAN